MPTFPADKISLADLKAAIQAIIWPNGAPENLLAPISAFFAEACIIIQQDVECYQEQHVDVFPQCSTYWKCGLTILDRPQGVIRKVYTVQNENYCNPVTLVQATASDLRCWSREFTEIVTAPANEGLPGLPLGYWFAEQSTDSQWGRALLGLWAIEKDKILIAPWIQSKEAVVIEWDGMKREFTDLDLLPNEARFKRAVRLWVQKEFERDFGGDLNRQKKFEMDWQDALGDLIQECHDQTRLQQSEICEEEQTALALHRGEDDTSGEDEGPITVFAMIGDLGSGNHGKGVSDLVNSFGPAAVITSGDNIDDGGHSYDQSVGQWYSRYILPYSGQFPPDTVPNANAFWPALGNHDLDQFTDFQKFFPSLPGNKRFYDVLVGSIHFFILNSGVNSSGVLVETAGNTSNSDQANWLRMRLAQSVARWKVVVDHFPQYCSGGAPNRYPGFDFMRWPFQRWGAHVVISGHNHNYERLEVDGFPYIVNGLGGGAMYQFNPAQILPESVVRFADDFGALIGTATCKSLTLQFFTQANLLIDTLVIE